MARFIIHGHRPLSGTFQPMGNKNAVLPMLAACLLTDEPVVLQNVPRILDVRVMLELLEKLGVHVSSRGQRLELQAAGIRKRVLDPDLCRQVRTSILLAGPLVARYGKATVHPPGGDVIGRRRLDAHFYGLSRLGIRISSEPPYAFEKKRLRGTTILLDEASVTATEHIMMTATLVPGQTVIYNAACEPHVQDLGTLLTKMGADLEGLGTNRITIRGVKTLKGARHRVSPDHIELASFLAASAITGGSIVVKDLPPAGVMEVVRRTFQKLGLNWTIEEGVLKQPKPKRLAIQPELGSVMPKIEDGTWPSFPSDLMSVAVVLATQARGNVLFFEKLFESRMYFVDHLIAMGADIIQCDPHRAVVAGPSCLHGCRLTSPDIRAGMAVILAALCAKGQSIVENAQVVDRGYAEIDKRLRALGADIVREE